MTFTVGATSHTVTSFEVYIKKTGDPGTVTFSITETDESGLPTGLDLTSGTLADTSISTSYAWKSITTTEMGLEAGEVYAIVIRAVDGDDSNDIQWRADTGGGLADAVGASSTDSGDSWASETPADYLFKIIGNPCIDVISGAVYEDYIEDGDMLFLFHYKNIYPPYYPYGDAGLYFMLQLIDTDDATVLAAVPCPQWGYVPGSIYISADSAAALTVSSAYYLRIYGMFGDNPTAEYQLEGSDWIGDIEALLDAWVLRVASDMEDYYELELTTQVSGMTMLNDVGGVPFIIGIPYLDIVRPELFEDIAASVSHADVTLTDSFSAQDTWQAVVGSDLENLAGDAGTILGIDDHTALGLMFVFGYIILAVVVYPSGHTNQGLALGFPIIIAAAAMFLIDISIIAVIVSVAVLLAVWAFWLTRT